MSKKRLDDPTRARSLLKQIMIIVDRNKNNEEFLRLLLIRAKSLDRLIK